MEINLQDLVLRFAHKMLVRNTSISYDNRWMDVAINRVLNDVITDSLEEILNEDGHVDADKRNDIIHHNVDYLAGTSLTYTDKSAIVVAFGIDEAMEHARDWNDIPTLNLMVYAVLRYYMAKIDFCKLIRVVKIAEENNEDDEDDEDSEDDEDDDDDVDDENERAEGEESERAEGEESG